MKYILVTVTAFCLIYYAFNLVWIAVEKGIRKFRRKRQIKKALKRFKQQRNEVMYPN